MPSTRNFHAKIAKTAKASRAILLHRMGAAKIFPIRPQGTIKKSYADLGILDVRCVITAAFGFKCESSGQWHLTADRIRRMTNLSQAAQNAASQFTASRIAHFRY